MVVMKQDAGEVVAVRLQSLVEDVPGSRQIGDPGAEVTGIAYDSRRVKPGDLFVAIRGRVHDGHDFIGPARQAGASAVMVEDEVRAGAGPGIVVPDSRHALGIVSSRFFGYPSQSLKVMGVTGTNGKTTTTYLLRSILRAAGRQVGLIGTVAHFLGDQSVPAERTTPESYDLQALFAQMKERGLTHVVMEVSSIALELWRLAGTDMDVGVFTNLTQDHLDFHVSLEAYRDAKARLFASIEPRAGRFAVVNADDPASRHMAEHSRVHVWTYSYEDPMSDVCAERVELLPGGSRFLLTGPSGRAPVRLHLAGRFNVENALAAATAALGEGVDVETIARGLGAVQGVPGRLQSVNEGQPFGVIVDYAHTPDGLERVLEATREFTRGRVLLVFGCGGDRDRQKRPLMGRVAARLADRIFLTSDNPRSEDPQTILDEVAAGIRAEGVRPQLVEIDRRVAIRSALQEARAGDTVLIAGKGHETYQILGDRVIPFSDAEVAADILREGGSSAC